jgi:hypothetical protein
MGSIRARIAIVVLLIGAGPHSLQAGELIAVRSGLWSEESTWIPSGIPGSGDTVYVGTGYPGSAQAITVSLDRDESAVDVVLGRDGNSRGTLDLGDHRLTSVAIVLGAQAGSTGAIDRGTGSFSTQILVIRNGSHLDMAAGDEVRGDTHVESSTLVLGAGAKATNLNIRNGSTATTTDSGNISGEVGLDASSRLNLGGNLVVSRGLDVNLYGEVNANGHDMSGRILRLSDTTQLNDRGSIDFFGFEIFNRQFDLRSGDLIGGFGLALGSESTLGAGVIVGNLSLSNGSHATLTENDNVSSDIRMGTGSRLDLNSNVELNVIDARDRGTIIDAQGYDITARGDGLAIFGEATLINDGAITTRILTVNGGLLELTGGNDTVTLGIGLSNGGLLRIGQRLGESTGLTLDYNGDIGINDYSLLDLRFAETPGESCIFRWRGSWIDRIGSLIDQGRISVTSSAGYEVLERDGFTYISQTYIPAAVPEPSSIISMALGLGGGLIGLRKRLHVSGR